MVRACILIRVVPKRARDVFNDIRMIGGVKKVMMVYGRFDIVALLEMDDIDGIV
ncbi:MAG: Lrp/AsnC family transcriptional regulator, partial [Thermoproteota archaeon]